MGEGRERAAAELARRLSELGLTGVDGVVVHRNRTVVVSLTARRVLRVHEGFSMAPDRVLKAIVRFVRLGTPTALRRAAHREIVTFPVELHAPARSRAGRHRPEDAELLGELQRRHARLNARFFSGALRGVTFRVSGRMRERLGEYIAGRNGAPGEIAVSRRHIRKDGWDEVNHTLLHEMIHQWQAERGKRVDHGREFRAKARDVGIHPGSRRYLGLEKAG